MLRSIVMFLLTLLVLVSNVHAAVECVSIDRSGMSQGQKNQMQGIAYAVIFDAGDDIIPTFSGNDVCFDTPTVDINTVITLTTLTDRYNSEKASRDAARAVQLARLSAAQTEFNGSEIKDISLSQINTKINNISNLTELKTFLKKFVRYTISQEIRQGTND